MFVTPFYWDTMDTMGISTDNIVFLPFLSIFPNGKFTGNERTYSNIVNMSYLVGGP